MVVYMKQKKNVRRFKFRFTLITVILGIVLSMTVISTILILTATGGASEEAASNLFEAATKSVQAHLSSVIAEGVTLANTASATTNLFIPPGGNGTAHPAFPFLVQSLQTFPRLYSIYAGFSDGEFLQLIDARGNNSVLTAHNAPIGTRYILRTIVGTGAERRENWTYLDGSRNVLFRHTVNTPEYDPRVRAWYRGANRLSAVVTDPYFFSSLQQPGITASRQLADGSGVIGVDLTVEALQRFVDEYTGVPGGGILILDSDNRVVAVSDPLLTTFGIVTPHEPLPPAPESAILDPGIHYISNGKWIAAGVTQRNYGGKEWQIVIAAPTTSFSGPFDKLRLQILVATLVLIALVVPLILRVTVTMTRVLTQLSEDSLRISRMEFAATPSISTRIREFHQFSSAFTVMKDTIAARTSSLETTLIRLEKLIDLNIAISAEQSIEHLTELILSGARELSYADGGSLYLVNPDRTKIEFKIVLNNTLQFKQGGTSTNPITLPPVALYDDEGNKNHHNVVSSAFHSGKTVNLEDAYDDSKYDFSGTRHFDSENGYRSTSFLTVPLKPRGARIIGAIQLINSINPETDEIQPFTPELQRFVEALSAGAATALYNRDLLETQKRLFDAMIQLIAGAIDAKSPYTGSHCERVPEIAMMLANEAEKVTTGSLASFSLSDEEERRAFRLGAWLHDAGKVTTPEFVVDKATKLETIYDRIHEIRTRFEVLLRDEQIAMYKAIASGTPRDLAEAEFHRKAGILEEEFSFLASCNLGGESLSDENKRRIKEIGEHRWYRHFNDRLGLSWVELNRYPAERGDEYAATVDNPVEERLLADKPHHKIPRTIDIQKLYGKYKFRIEVPENLYDRGEIYNLLIDRGTLTPEERFKIKEHVMQTIRMLDTLPLPPELHRVVEYAGTHHEALNGTGYPWGLTNADLSIPARIMAIADIFEALSASDRPYKKAKPLSVIVRILHEFKEDGHIDAELFDLFLTTGAYRRYAERFLRPEQLDDVDIDRYLG